MNTKNYSIYLTIATFVLIALSAVMTTLPKVYAAGVSVSLSPSAISSATPTNVTVSYTASAQYASGNTVVISVPVGVTLANCVSATTNADGDGTPDGSSGVSGQNYTYTFSASTTAATTTGVSFCINVSAPTGNYAVSFTDSKTNSANNDYGAALVYAGSANVVNVTATVQPALAFVIRDSSDSTNTTNCALGTLSLTAVNTCSYRLKVTTNAASGYTISINSDGDLRKSGSGDVAAALDINLIADNVTVASGTEGYGVVVSAGSVSGGSATLSTTAGWNFNVNDTPLPINAAKTLLTTNGYNNPAASGDTTYTTLVTHRAAMDGTTTSGNYQQAVTYTVSASF